MLTATDDAWAPGLAAGACDVIYARMVYHMIPEPTLATYLPQWRRALKPGGRMLILDHNPDATTTRGARQPMSMMPWMTVVPQETEVAEIVAGGPFVLSEGPFTHPYFPFGYGALYRAG